MLDISYYIITSILLYAVGVYTLATKRNMIRLIIAIEIILDAAHLNFLAFSAVRYGESSIDPLTHTIVINSIIIGGCVIAIALSVAVNAYGHYKTLDVRELRRLRR